MNTVVNVCHIVDDDPDVKYLITETLKDHGMEQYVIHFHHDPNKFIQDMPESDINIVVLDHILTGKLNGLDMIKMLRQHNKYVYVIVMSGQDNKGVAIRYLNEGADKYIDKNWNKEEIAEILGDEWELKRPPSYLDVFVKYLKEAFIKATERIRMVKLLEREISKHELASG